MHFDRLIEFIRLTHAFQQIQRSIYATGEDRFEHDAEHSYQLAMVAWYIIESEKLQLDSNIAVKYALAHDLVEIYAGDTPRFGVGSEMKGDKEEREQAAYEKLRAEFPEFPELFELIKQYEAKEDPESKFIYALDKFLSSANIYLDHGRSWFKNNVTLQEMIDSKKSRMIDGTVDTYFEALIERLRSEETILFPQK